MANKTVSRIALFGIAAPIFIVGAITMSAKPATAQGPLNQSLVIQVGKDLFYETDLSNPTGVACATCHDPSAGFSSPNSSANKNLGTMPGAVAGRFGNRKAPTVSYSSFIPVGPPKLDNTIGAFVGGMFYDGRANTLAIQAQGPFQNPNEMNNVVHNLGSPQMVVEALERGPNAAQFKQCYGANVFNQPVAPVFQLMVQSLAAYESSTQVSPFNSKYDMFLEGKARFTAQEIVGLQIFTGSLTGRAGGPASPINAQCSLCHALASSPGAGPDLFTDSHYVNVGIPKNLANPYYAMTNAVADPAGYNSLGSSYIDFGLAKTLYTTTAQLNADALQVKGCFKIPTLRNVDSRPYATFVKAYGHNGFFKSLQQVVHFYNTRNLTTKAGEVIDFTKANPYAGLKGQPLWPAPECVNNMLNPSGLKTGDGLHIGNIGLTAAQEADLVAFLQTLTDGFQATPSTP
ncbi:MAG TPA: cytochrome c peroxidase [Fimbriimonadaceae bacterium]